MDVIAINKFLLGAKTLEGTGLANADVDLNKTVDSNDALDILNVRWASLTSCRQSDYNRQSPPIWEGFLYPKSKAPPSARGSFPVTGITAGDSEGSAGWNRLQN